MTMPNIRAVAFDVGGVVELSERRDILEQIAHVAGVPIQDLKKVYWEYNYLSNVENMTWEDMVMKVVRVFNQNEETERDVRKIVEEYNAAKTINAGLVGIFPVLREMGLKVAIFSNATAALRDHLEEMGVAGIVDVMVISGEIGYQKPQKEAFAVLFDQLGFRPEEVIFVDDTPKSLETADEIGYVPILFKNNEQLEDDLRKAGVPLP
jgi:putative hydrolase of the HAD superfamily